MYVSFLGVVFFFLIPGICALYKSIKDFRVILWHGCPVGICCFVLQS